MKKFMAVVLAAATVASLGVTTFAAKDATYSGKEVFFGPSGLSLTGGDTFSENWVLYDNGKNITAGEVAQPDQSLYFSIGTAADTKTADILFDSDNAKVKFDKGDENAKMIKSMSLADKKLAGFNGGNRHGYVKIELKNDMTDSEYKLNPAITFTAKKWMDFTAAGITAVYDTEAEAIAAGNTFVEPGTKVTFELKLWMGNWGDTADKDYEAGKGGVMLKPVKNEDNEILWTDANRDLAKLTFVGDSDVVKVFPKLSTKWENSDYAEYFADQDAFLFDFVGNMASATKISSTSRADLEIYNPYYDDDEDELRVDPEDVIIYQVATDGTFTDVTAQFKAGENDDGDYVFTTKTRELGTYIFAEKVAGATTEDEVIDAPDTGKEIPNTGR